MTFILYLLFSTELRKIILCSILAESFLDWLAYM